MIAISIGFMFLLTAVVMWFSTRDWLSPPMVFALAWGVTLTGVGLAAPFGYFQISMSAGMIFILGAACFFLGSSMIQVISEKKSHSAINDLDFEKLAFFSVAAHFVLIPIAIADIRAIAGDAEDIFQLAFRLRIGSVTGEESVGPITGNYITLGLLVLPLLLIGYLRGKTSGFLFIFIAVPWVLLGLLVGGRSGLITLIFASMYVFLSFGGRLSFKALASVFLFFCLILISGNLLVNKIDARLEDGIFIVLAQSLKGFFDYAFAGPILFSRYVGEPTQLVPTWDALVFPCHLLEKIGLCTVPSVHQEFLSMNVYGDLGNVYSVFFSIVPKYGFLGLIVIMIFYGGMAAYFHERRYANPFHLLVAAFLFSSTLLSVWSDGFGSNLYFFLKIFLFTLVIKFAFTTPVTGGDNAGRLAA